MFAWKNIPVFALAIFLLMSTGEGISYAQGADDQGASPQVIDFTFREISLGDTFKAARTKVEKLKFKFFYIKEALPEVPEFIRARDCNGNENCDKLLIYFNFTDYAGYVSRIVYSHKVEASLDTEDVISALEESYGPSTLKIEEKPGTGENYIQWGGDNKPDSFNRKDIEKMPELVAGRYMLATILKDKYGTLNLTLEITDSQKFIDGKDEIDRLTKLNAQQEKEVARKNMKFR